MKLLVLGGTVFVGRAIVETALARGHDVTLFNRGTHPAVFPQLERIKGDRTRDVDALRGRWDAVVDPSGYLPRVVRMSAERLADTVDRYVFVSSLSVYASPPANTNERGTLATLVDPTVETVDGDTYGPLKALCEAEVERAFPGRAWVVRPGLIVGPHDPTDRFTYWPHRFALGGDVLAPAPRDARVQFIDVRDLAEWIVRGLESRIAGVHNAVGPQTPLTFEALLEACRAESGTDARIVWADEALLLAEQVAPWTGLPLWLPSTLTDFAHFAEFDARRAFADGLVCRPLHETVRATREWAATRPADHVWRAGLDARREAQVLARCMRAPEGATATVRA